MKINFAYSLSIFFLIAISGYGQDNKPLLKGLIDNYANSSIYLYQFYGDTLMLIDSTHTDKKGNFVFNQAEQVQGLYKVELQENQGFFLLFDEQTTEIRSSFKSDKFNNIASDSLRIIRSDVNKQFLHFQQINQEWQIAAYFLLNMMRIYPITDPFHQKMEAEYNTRYEMLEKFIKDLNDEKQTQAAKFAFAYFQPVNPDWKQPDHWRDSILAQHFFDHFNPADAFYLHSNILPDKIDLYLAMSTNRKDAYGQPIKDDQIALQAAETFLNKTKSNAENFEFCLNYFLKKFNAEHKNNLLLSLYDKYLVAEGENCNPNDKSFDWIREKVNTLRNIQIGQIAPDFKLGEKLNLRTIPGDYTLLLFWATWCGHCTEFVPQVKKTVDEFNKNISENSKGLITVAVSLDTDEKPWQQFVNEQQLFSFINYSDLKGWGGEVSKLYNIYATPSMFLLDKDKKIVAIPETHDELIQSLNKLNKKLTIDN
jgi:thiol-disulfide isomerase/thioredoxin